ncbi:MAG: metallophosphoesterase [Planctomycetales bacterium]|nr:metallophosphoesterase [Planctomycetales bacterium]
MSERRFRFIHAADLHLEQPLHGVDFVPEHLRDLFLDAPFHAAQAVFDHAVEEHVDFVVLSGDVLDPRAGGPRAVSFLFNQLTRLQQKKIDVYWCGGTIDNFSSWPTSIALPPNVHIFPTDRVAAHLVRRGDTALATVQGCSYHRERIVRGTDFAGEAAGFCIAVAHGQATAADLQQPHVDYWTLGGRHNVTTLFHSHHVAQFAGSPQGRRPSETGPHGCILVEVENDAIANRQLLPTDRIRWHQEKFELPDEMDSAGLQRKLRERTEQLLDANRGQWMLVQWTLLDGDQTTDTRSDQLAANLRQGGLADDLLAGLRSEFGTRDCGAWTVSLQAETPVVFPAGWYEEDTVLGDLLRSVKQHQDKSDLELLLEGPDEGYELSAELSAALQINDNQERAVILRNVAALGVDLLRGDRVLSEEMASMTKWMSQDDDSI